MVSSHETVLTLIVQVDVVTVISPFADKLYMLDFKAITSQQDCCLREVRGVTLLGITANPSDVANL
jgi:hypothetical protein